jgi:hypothetical protein
LYSPLAVCKGLVIDRIQRIYYKAPVIPTRYSCSYGILCCERSDKKHAAQGPVKNSLDGNKYAENRIDWLIRAGEKIQKGKAPPRRYSRIVSPDYPDKNWRLALVTSELAGDVLPEFWDGKDDIKVSYYTVSCSAIRPDDVGVIPKRKTFLVGPEYWQVNYNVCFIIEYGEPMFEIKINGDTRAITVEYEGSQQVGGMEEGNGSRDGFIIGW